MMYYLYKDIHHKISIYPSEMTYYELEKDGYELHGQFGRLDYAKHWKDYKNGEISEQAHKRFLGLL